MALRVRKLMLLKASYHSLVIVTDLTVALNQIAICVGQIGVLWLKVKENRSATKKRFDIFTIKLWK